MDTDEHAVRVLCHAYAPFTITADLGVVLRAEVKRFSYTYRGRKETLHWEHYALRLVPENDKLLSLEMHNRHGLAINNMLSTPDFVRLEVGNGGCVVEVYYHETDPDQIPLLYPHKGFKEEVVRDPKLDELFLF